MPPNVDKTIARINGMIQDFKKVPKQTELFAANQAKILILRRVFSEGKAANGTDIGKYDNERKQTFLTNKASFTKKQQKTLDKQKEGLTYEQLRALKGLRIDKVDLQFSGRLFESIEVVEINGKFTLGITDEGRAKIAGYLEKKYGKDIFAIKGKELESLMESVTKYAQQLFQKIVKKWSQA